MTQQTLVSAAFTRLVGAINAVHNLVTTADAEIGDISTLTTTNTSSLTAAVNEVKTAIDAVSGGASIDDGAPTSGTVWSSSKTQTEIVTAVANALEGEDLSDIAAQITALVSADAGLLNVDAAQGLSSAQQLQGCQNLDIGDPTHDYVTAINAGINPGL